jgi:hypothetical protein
MSPLPYYSAGAVMLPVPAQSAATASLVEYLYKISADGDKLTQLIKINGVVGMINAKQSDFALAKTDSLAAEFALLAKQWKEETVAYSSMTKMFSHPAYVRIIGMGKKDGIPLVLRELQKNQGGWFYALKFMAGEDLSKGMANFEDAKAAWLEWGYKNNYI